MFLLLISVLISCLVYIYVIKPMQYWKEKQIPHVTPWFALKSFWKVLIRQRSLAHFTEDLYKLFPNERYFGSYIFATPQLFIKDPELIKQIAIKDFDKFVNRSRQFSSETDPLFSKNLLALEDDQWRTMRSTLSPTFTSSKMKFIYDLMYDYAQDFVKYFEDHESQSRCLEMKDVFSRFTSDMIASSAFGISTNSLVEKNNEFFLRGKEFTDVGGIRLFMFIIYTYIPMLRKIFKVPFVQSNVSDFYQNAIDETVRIRKEQNFIRPDMVHMLMQSQNETLENDDKNKRKKIITNEDLAAQGILFFLAGFDTVSNALTFTSYELAMNPEVQKRLQNEIDEAIKTSDGKVSYSVVMNLEYLDMVVSESLRKWPPGISFDRICNKNYTIQPARKNEKPLELQKEIHVYVSIYAIHRDEKFFPEPEKFNPERFSKKNKDSIVSGSYIPFGVGPKTCIASRFSIMEMKILVFHLLSKFNIIKNEKTKPMSVMSKGLFDLAAADDVWLTFTCR